jgi:hypothetical protein
MKSVSTTVPRQAILLFGGFASLLLASQVNAQATVPRFTYGAGAQGFGYYANPRTATATQPVTTTRTPARTQQGAGRIVGPGARDWTTGRRGRLHKPWLRPMD